MTRHINGWPFSPRQSAAGLDLLQFGARPFDLFHYVFHRRRPNKRMGALVPCCQELSNGLLQIRHAHKSAAANSFLAEFLKPTLNQIEPTGTGRNEVADKAWMLLQPGLHARLFVCPIV